MRIGIILFGVLLGLTLSSGCDSGSAVGDKPAAKSEHVNYLLITIDTLRADHLGYAGYSRATSPFIDSLAESGTAFMAAQAQWPKTAPSVASFITGTYPITNRVQRLRVQLDDSLTTMAEIMKSNGYATCAFVANVNASSLYNFQQGFDEFYEMWDKSGNTPRQNQGTDFFNNDQILELVQEWMKKQTHDQPFFLWVHLLDPHGPYEPPKRYAGKFGDDDIIRSQTDIPPAKMMPGYQIIEGLETRGDYIAAYDEEILYSDDFVGGVVSQLEESGMRNNTLLVLSADHGESLGEHDYWFNHGNYAYQASVNVPLIFSQPGVVPANKKIDTPVGLIDLLPTIVDILQVDPGRTIEQFQGRSLVGALAGDSLPDRPVYTQCRDGQLAVRLGRWKYIYDPRKSTPQIPVIADRQLYDLNVDPHETNNLVSAEADVAIKLHEMLQQWTKYIKQWEMGIKEKSLDDTLSPADKARLKSLGYLGEDE